MSSLSHENKAIGLCHDCSSEIEEDRLALKMTRCRKCAKRASVSAKRRRAELITERDVLVADMARLMGEIASRVAEANALLAKLRSKGPT